MSKLSVGSPELAAGFSSLTPLREVLPSPHAEISSNDYEATQTLLGISRSLNRIGVLGYREKPWHNYRWVSMDTDFVASFPSPAL